METGCELTGGTWISYYDGQEVTSAGALDIDHMVPLAEAWDSGASAWTAARREAYANDQDPTDWMPPSPEAQCRYVGEWVATKIRWQLTADDCELETLKAYADGPCEDTVVRYTPAA